MIRRLAGLDSGLGKRRAVRQPGMVEGRTPETRRLMHELREHQLELEVQNVELMVSRAEAERAAVRYTELYDQAPVAYLTLTPDGRIRQWNRAAARLLGLDDRRRGGWLSGCLHPEDVPGFEQFLARLFSRQSGPSMSLRLQVRGGRRATVQIQAVASADGGECRVVLIETTDRRRMEELESELNQTRRIQALGRLAAGVAHEINNELASIMALLALPVVPACRSPEMRRLLARVGGCADRAAGVVRQLLMFGRPAPLDIRRVDANAAVRDMSDFLRKTMGEDYGIVLEMGRGLPPVEADVGLLQQAFLNLVLNARDAMPGGGTIRVSTRVMTVDARQARKHPDRRPGRFVVVAVTDHGCGIPSQDLARIFEPFFTTKRAGVGTGLGLPMVRDTVARHHGWVEVESSPGSGSVFRIALPAMAGPEKMKREGSARRRGGMLKGRETLLLVEDSEALRATLKDYLASLGYRVQVAGSGTQAIRVWKRRRAELLLSDEILPGGMTGHQLAGRLRQDVPGLPVIISSGYPVTEHGRSEAGIVFIPKPSSLVTLGTAIRQCLDAGRGTTTP